MKITVESPPEIPGAELAPAVRAARAAAGLTGAELADRLGWSRTRVGQIEAGTQQTIHRETVLRLAGALGVEPAELHPALAWVALPPEAVVLAADPDSRHAYRPWRQADRAALDALGELAGPIGHERLAPLAAALGEAGRPLCLLP